MKNINPPVRKAGITFTLFVACWAATTTGPLPVFAVLGGDL